MKNEKWNMKEYILVLFLILVMILHFIMEHILTSKISCSIFIFGLKQFSNDLSFQVIISNINYKVRKSSFFPFSNLFL